MEVNLEKPAHPEGKLNPVVVLPKAVTVAPRQRERTTLSIYETSILRACFSYDSSER